MAIKSMIFRLAAVLLPLLLLPVALRAELGLHWSSEIATTKMLQLWQHRGPTRTRWRRRWGA